MLDEIVLTAAVRSHRLKLRVMTSVAFLFGFLAVATGIFIVWFYLIMYLPKQRQMIEDAEIATRFFRVHFNPQAEFVVTGANDEYTLASAISARHGLLSRAARAFSTLSRRATQR